MISLKVLNKKIQNESQVLKSGRKNKNDKEGIFFFQILKILRIIPNIITKNMIWNPIA